MSRFTKLLLINAVLLNSATFSMEPSKKSDFLKKIEQGREERKKELEAKKGAILEQEQQNIIARNQMREKMKENYQDFLSETQSDVDNFFTYLSRLQQEAGSVEFPDISQSKEQKEKYTHAQQVMSDIAERVKILKEDQKNKEQQMQKLQEEKQSLEVKLQENMTAIQSEKGNKEALQRANAEIKSKLGETEKETAALREKSHKAGMSVKRLGEQRDKLLVLTKKLQKKLKQSEEKFEQSEKRFEQSEKRFKKLQLEKKAGDEEFNELAEENNKLIDVHKELEAKYKNLQNTLVDLQLDLDGKNTEKENLKTELDLLKEENEMTSGENEELKAQIEAKAQELQQLNQKMEEEGQKINVLAARQAELMAAKASVETQLKEVQSALLNTKGKYKASKEVCQNQSDEIAALKMQLAEAQAKNATYEQSNQELDTALASVNMTRAAFNSDIQRFLQQMKIYGEKYATTEEVQLGLKIGQLHAALEDTYEELKKYKIAMATLIDKSDKATFGGLNEGEINGALEAGNLNREEVRKREIKKVRINTSRPTTLDTQQNQTTTTTTDPTVSASPTTTTTTTVVTPDTALQPSPSGHSEGEEQQQVRGQDLGAPPANTGDDDDGKDKDKKKSSSSSSSSSSSEDDEKGKGKERAKEKKKVVDSTTSQMPTDPGGLGLTPERLQALRRGLNPIDKSHLK